MRWMFVLVNMFQHLSSLICKVRTCVNLVFRNECLGPFWNTSTFGHLTASKKIYDDNFFLIVKKTSPSTLTTILGVFYAFTAWAWMLIGITILIFGLVVDMLQFGWSIECLKEISHCSRLCNMIYSSMTVSERLLIIIQDMKQFEAHS